MPVMILVPPCVEALIPLAIEGDETALRIVAAYAKSHWSIAQLYDKLPSLADKLLPIINRNNLPPFSCNLVAEAGHMDKCDQTRCPFLAARDPVGFILDQTEKITYNITTREFKLYFPRARRPLIIPANGSVVNRAEVEGSIRTFMLEYSGIMPSLRPYRDPDTGERRDPMDELIMLAYQRATSVIEDEHGVGEVLLHLVQSYPVVAPEMATVASQLFIYIDQKNHKYLAVATKLMRTAARQYLGISSIKKLTQLLNNYGIEKRRIRLHGERGYFYMVPEEVFVKLTGESLDDVLNPVKELDVETLWGDE